MQKKKRRGKRRRKTSRKAKTRLFLFAPISVILIVYFVISSTNYALNIIDLNKQETSLKEELVSLKEDEENLKNEIQKLKDPDYIARFARENYLYSKNGEYVIKITDDNKVQKKSDTGMNQIYLEYAIAGCAVFGVVVFIWMIRKK